MKSALFSFLFIFAAQTQAYANEVVLSPGSSAIVRANQETLVSCGGNFGGGHQGGRRDRCECVSESQSCAYGYQNRYVLKVDGIVVKDTNCRSSPAEAGEACMQAKSAYPGCR